jgi:hypothetical protein
LLAFGHPLILCPSLTFVLNVSSLSLLGLPFLFHTDCGFGQNSKFKFSFEFTSGLASIEQELELLLLLVELLNLAYSMLIILDW